MQSGGAPLAFAAVLAMAAVLTVLAPAAAVAQQIDGTPPTGARARDFSGVWMNDYTLEEVLRRSGKKRFGADTTKVQAENAAVTGRIPDDVLTPEYAAIQRQLKADAARLEEGAAACHWPGMPAIMTYPFPLEFLHTLGRITLLFEAESQVRRIFLDRTRHLDPDDLDPSYNGDSIGHWEGNTLVVDTIGFNTLTTLRGLPHSEQLHLIERIRYVGATTIVDDMLFTDPLAFRKPVDLRVFYSRRPGWRIREYSCEENNRSAPDAQGRRSNAIVKP